MAGTLDSAIRAFDVTNGEELWKGALPTSARATPMTFRGPNDKQYLVISAGGHGIREAGSLGDSLLSGRVQTSGVRFQRPLSLSALDHVVPEPAPTAVSGL